MEAARPKDLADEPPQAVTRARKAKLPKLAIGAANAVKPFSNPEALTAHGDGEAPLAVEQLKKIDIML